MNFKLLIPLAIIPFLPFLPWWGHGVNEEVLPVTSEVPAEPEVPVLRDGDCLFTWSVGERPETVCEDDWSQLNLPDLPNDAVRMCTDPETGVTGWQRCIDMRNEDNIECVLAAGAPDDDCIWCHVCYDENGNGDPIPDGNCDCWGRGSRAFPSQGPPGTGQ